MISESPARGLPQSSAGLVFCEGMILMRYRGHHRSTFHHSTLYIGPNSTMPEVLDFFGKRS